MANYQKMKCFQVGYGGYAFTIAIEARSGHHALRIYYKADGRKIEDVAVRPDGTMLARITDDYDGRIWYASARLHP